MGPRSGFRAPGLAASRFRFSPRGAAPKKRSQSLRCSSFTSSDRMPTSPDGRVVGNRKTAARADATATAEVSPDTLLPIHFDFPYRIGLKAYRGACGLSSAMRPRAALEGCVKALCFGFPTGNIRGRGVYGDMTSAYHTCR